MPDADITFTQRVSAGQYTSPLIDAALATLRLERDLLEKDRDDWRVRAEKAEATLANIWRSAS